MSAVFLIAASFLAWASLAACEGKIDLQAPGGFPSSEGAEASNVRLLEYVSGKLRLEVQARKTVFSPAGDAATLFEIEGTADDERTGPIIFKAGSGMLQLRSGDLQLDGPISLTRRAAGSPGVAGAGSLRYLKNSDQADVAGPVSISFRGIRLSAPSARIDGARRVVEFKGGVKALLSIEESRLP